MKINVGIRTDQRKIIRNTDPLMNAVVTVTQFHSGSANNIIPDDAVVSGTCRALSDDVQNMIEARMVQVAGGIAAAHGATATVDYRRNYPVLVNTEKETQKAAQAAAKVVGEDQVHNDIPPVMGSEDFAFMLQEKPGSYVWIGNGFRAGADGDPCMLHNPHYDFNDEILSVGASYWATLTEQELASEA